MAFDPQAARLVLLSQLAHEKPASKVRFLGCVNEYRPRTADLILVERYPVLRSRSVIKVNIENILDSIDPQTLDTGAWINVIGYVQAVEPRQDAAEATTSSNGRKSKKAKLIIMATSIWSAGAIKLDEYTAAVQALQKT